MQGLVAAQRQAGSGEVEPGHGKTLDLVAQEVQLLVLVGVRLVDLSEPDEPARIRGAGSREVLGQVAVDVVVLQDRRRDAGVIHRGDDDLGRGRKVGHVGRQELHVGRLRRPCPIRSGRIVRRENPRRWHVRAGEGSSALQRTRSATRA